MYLVENHATSTATGLHAPAFWANIFGALERIFAQNARSVLPFMGRLLSVLVSIMPTSVKTSTDRILTANTLEVLADVMQENTTWFEQEINQSSRSMESSCNQQQALAVVEATLAADQQQFNRCYSIVLSEWLHAKSADGDLQSALISALGALAAVISIEKLTDSVSFYLLT